MTCEKIPYDNYKIAIKALKGISTKVKRSFNVYKCAECKKFHLSSVKHVKIKIKSEKIKPTVDRMLLSPGHRLDQDIRDAKAHKHNIVPSINPPLATFKLGQIMNWPIK